MFGTLPVEYLIFSNMMAAVCCPIMINPSGADAAIFQETGVNIMAAYALDHSKTSASAHDI